MVESVGKTVTAFAGYDDMEVVNPDGDGEASGNPGWAQGHDRRKHYENNEEAQSFWARAQKMIGSDVTSMLSVPVWFMEPISVIQKMSEIMEYPFLLDRAAKADEPAERMAYVAIFGAAVYAAVERYNKPFNPILGETFQFKVGEDGQYLAEQVSHHPPIGAAHAESPLWMYDIVSCPRTKFLGNSLEVYPVGRTRIKLKTTGEEISLVPPMNKAYNLVIGSMWIDTCGKMTFKSTTGWSCVLDFIPCGLLGYSRYVVKGNVFDPEGKPMLYIEGKWNESMGFCPCDADGKPVAGAERKVVWNASEKPQGDSYGFTNFVHEHLNAGGLKVLPSDSRLRPDRAALQEGNSAEAQSYKHKLEEMQRAEKKKRVGDNDTFSPRYFQLAKDYKLFEGEYKEDDVPYWTFKGEFPSEDKLVDLPEEYADKAADMYCPWQYPDMHA